MGLKIRIVSLISAAILALVGMTSAVAQDTGQTGQVPVDVEVGAAPGAGLRWTITINSEFPPVPSSFEAQTTSGSMTLTVEDTRGTEAGWVLTVSATDFIGQNSGRTFPAGNLVVSPGAVNVVAGDASPLPIVNGLTMSGTAQTLISAAASSGAGRYSVILTGTVTVPGNTLVDTYVSTITVDLATAP
jgi:hypothetical protein